MPTPANLTTHSSVSRNSLQMAHRPTRNAQPAKRKTNALSTQWPRRGSNWRITWPGNGGRRNTFPSGRRDRWFDILPSPSSLPAWLGVRHLRTRDGSCLCRLCRSAAGRFDPDEGHPEGTYWRTYAEQIEAVLAEMVPKERLDGVRTEAAEVGLAARLADQNRSLDEAVWVVRLVSGMTSSDWRHIESQVLSLMDTLYPPLPLRQLAHRLRSRGWGYRRIAGELGVSVTHVRRLLDPDENSPS